MAEARRIIQVWTEPNGNMREGHGSVSSWMWCLCNDGMICLWDGYRWEEKPEFSRVPQPQQIDEIDKLVAVISEDALSEEQLSNTVSEEQ